MKRVDYIIECEDDLSKMRRNPDANFVLCDDIYVHEEFEPVDEFSGVLNGRGNRINGLLIDKTNGEAGVGFIKENRGLVRDLRLEDVNVRGYIMVGGIAGVNDGTIKNCFVSGITDARYNVGKIAGDNKSIIISCKSEGDVIGHTGVGGIVGSNSDMIVNCNSSDDVSGQENTGGLVGERNRGGITRNSSSTGTITAEGIEKGKIIGSDIGDDLSNMGYVNIDKSIIKTVQNGEYAGQFILDKS